MIMNKGKDPRPPCWFFKPPTAGPITRPPPPLDFPPQNPSDNLVPFCTANASPAKDFTPLGGNRQDCAVVACVVVWLLFKQSEQSALAKQHTMAAMLLPGDVLDVSLAAVCAPLIITKEHDVKKSIGFPGVPLSCRLRTTDDATVSALLQMMEVKQQQNKKQNQESRYPSSVIMLELPQSQTTLPSRFLSPRHAWAGPESDGRTARTVNRTVRTISGLVEVDMRATHLVMIEASSIGLLERLRRVQLPVSLTEVRDHFLVHCPVEHLDLRSTSLSKVGDAFLFECKQLVSVAFPDTLSEVGDRFLAGCRSIKEVDLSGSTRLETVNDEMCMDCCDLETLRLPKTIRIIGHSFAENCRTLKEIHLQHTSVTEIRPCFASSCSNLTSITLPETVSGGIFSGIEQCESLELIDLRNTGIHTLRSGCRDCPKVHTLRLPESLTSVAFMDRLKSLEEIDLSNTAITQLGRCTLRGCPNLTSVKFPNSLTAVSNGVLEGCTKLQKLDLSHTKLRSIGIDESQEFATDCTSLTTLLLPDTLAEVGKNILKRCGKLKFIQGPDVVQQVVRRGIFAQIAAAKKVAAIRDSGITAFCQTVEPEFAPLGGNRQDCAVVACAAMALLFVVPELMMVHNNQQQRLVIERALATLCAPIIIACEGDARAVPFTGVQLSFRLRTTDAATLTTLETCMQAHPTDHFNPEWLLDTDENAICSPQSSPAIVTVELPDDVSALPDHFLSGDSVTNHHCKKKNTVTEIDLRRSTALRDLGSMFGYEWERLRSVLLPATVTELRGGFLTGTAVESVDLSHTAIQSFGREPLEPSGFMNNCTRLTSVKFPPTLKILQADVLSHCPRLEEVDLRNTSLESVGLGFANQCKRLRKVMFPRTVVKVDERLFVGKRPQDDDDDPAVGWVTEVKIITGSGRGRRRLRNLSDDADDDHCRVTDAEPMTDKHILMNQQQDHPAAAAAEVMMADNDDDDASNKLTEESPAEFLSRVGYDPWGAVGLK